MTHLEAALEFVRSFCAGEIDSLGRLLADDFYLRGPLFEFDSKEAYLGALEREGLEKGSHTVTSAAMHQGKATVYYEYLKSGGALAIQQKFRFDEGKICCTELLFDSTGFA